MTDYEGVDVYKHNPQDYESPDGLCVFPMCERPTSEHLSFPLCNRHILAVHKAGKFLAQEATPLTAPRRARPLMKQADGCVYFLRLGNLIKIGFTTNLARRLKALPHEEVLGVRQGTMTDERALHEQFAHLRRTGEWYDAGPDLLAYIEALEEAA